MSTNPFCNGPLFVNGESIDIEKLTWNEHPTFKGVFLKHIIRGDSTNNQLSCHLVRVDASCELMLHSHAGKSELHEVIAGGGECTIDTETVSYRQGTVSLIPADKNHSVKAGKEGLLLLAKFFPALL